MAGIGVDTHPAVEPAGGLAPHPRAGRGARDLPQRARPRAQPLRACGKWEEEDAEEWDPIRAVKARLRDLDRRRQDQPTDVLHKVKLSLVSLLTHSRYLKFVVMVRTCTCMFEK
jgi:hypothetical protein